MTVAELSRTTARIEHLLDALVAQVSDVSSSVGALRGDMRSQQAVLELREKHQSERTANRDKQIADVHARLDAQQKAIADLQQARWTMSGRAAGALGLLTILGSGAVTAVARLIG